MDMHNFVFQQVVVTSDARINMDGDRLLPHEIDWVEGERAKKVVLEDAKAQKLVRIVICIHDPTFMCLRMHHGSIMVSCNI